MKELFYYSIFAVILYFVLTAIFDNFTLEQENFDPSLVPVSSIITLAKVAQKLVNGNGTLTNPGNLQIGSSASAPGNLTVTGNANINGKLFVGNENIVDTINSRVTTLDTTLNNRATTLETNLKSRVDTLDSTLNNRATALENTLKSRVDTLDSSLNDRATDILNTLTGKNTTLEITLNNKAIEFANSFTTKSLTVGGNLKLSSTTGDGFLKLGTDMWIKGVDESFRTYYGKNGRSYYGSGDGTHEWRVASNGSTTGMTLDTGGNLVVSGNLNVSGSSSSSVILITIPGNSAVDMVERAKPYFKSSDPDGKMLMFLFTSSDKKKSNLCPVVKMNGNQIWRYDLYLNTSPICNDCYNIPAGGNDGFRGTII